MFSDPAEQNTTLDLHAREAMQKGNYAVAFCIWQPLAQAGDSEAQFNIGWMYHNGYGLRIDDETALYWWLQSAASGFTDAHFALGDLYANGQGVEQNSAIALGWYISAALKGHLQAQETLSNILAGDDKLAKSTFQLLLQTDWSVLGETLEVSVDKANTRRGPATSYQVVAVLERGHAVIPLKQEGGWTYVGITGTGKTAWIFSSLISKPAGIYPLE
ncbi:MAG: SH3 domain-containing protein [Gammaproteobacteria bacterium]|nr:SH3 domain-containing protein [Gammaproteobacteria bacterium]